MGRGNGGERNNTEEQWMEYGAVGKAITYKRTLRGSNSEKGNQREGNVRRIS